MDDTRQIKKVIHLSDLHTGGGGSLIRQPEAVIDALVEAYDGRGEDYMDT